LNEQEDYLMASNLRAKPIEGHVTDSSGNVLRNAQIIIKQSTPSGSHPVDSAQSDESGYFVTKPLKAGTYEIYESGAMISRTIHNPGPLSLQCFKADPDNYNPADLKVFQDLIDEKRINEFKVLLQIESEETDIIQHGSSFPIYDFDISADPDFAGLESELFNLASFFNLDSTSRITTTRFDIEYFSPLTGASSSYRRIRWCGVPGIRFKKDSKILVPLDYYSIVANHSKILAPATVDFYPLITSEGTSEIMELESSQTSFVSLCSKVRPGDILKVYVGADPWYGIVLSYDANISLLTLQEWKSSRFTSNVDPSDNGLVTRIVAYDGMFQSLADIDDDANERFTVVENVYAQGLASELYNYNNI
jgi:hypothetical protein